MRKRIGILGFGVVGKSALKFLSLQCEKCDIGIWDHRKLSDQEIVFIKSCNAFCFDSVDVDLKTFFDLHDTILISPGIDLKKIVGGWFDADYSKKILCELDLFSNHFKKKTVAVTGTLGKTTITTLLANLTAKSGLNSAMGGNIGMGMLDLIDGQSNIDIAFLELSSFQLERSKTFAPYIAVWNNFYPNHLDRHNDLKNYFDAKFKIFEYQAISDFALLHSDILFMQEDFLRKRTNIKSKLCFITYDFQKTVSYLKKLPLNCYAIFFVKDHHLFFSENPFTQVRQLFDLSLVPYLTFTQNWVFILSVLSLLKIDLKFFERYFSQIRNEPLKDDMKKMLEHRVEKFAIINGVEFYNDSKATIVQATYCALKMLDQKGKPIILILGGLNKGVDRKPFVKKFSMIKNLKAVFCFGPQTKDFDFFPQYSSLDHLLLDILKLAKPGDMVLFSPGGASFDLFENYRQRGKVFKDLVLSLSQNE